MNKKTVIKTLERIAIYLEIKGENSFKISAYRKAAQALENDERSLEQMDDILKLKGIGKGTGQVIQELMESGQSTLLIELENEVPSGLLDLLQLPGLGGKKIAKLFQELKVIDLSSLKKACISGEVSQLQGFGQKTVEKLLEAIDSFGKRPERLPIAYMLPIAQEIEEQIKQTQHILHFSRAGSLRRSRETMKDLDFVIATHHVDSVSQSLQEKLDPAEVTGHGETKMSIILKDRYGVSVDFRFVEPEAFATALHHFTGSKDHNVKMRQLAKERKESISEYGVYNEQTEKLQQFKSEHDFFQHFGLQFIPPEVREGLNEIERAKHPLNLIQLEDIKSDLHMHTTWSDGAHTLSEMAEAARSRGYHFIVITDHSQSLRVANGLTEERLRAQRMEINKVNERYSDFKILAGVEMDILPDGRLDYDNDVLKEMDFVIAAIHSSFSQDQAAIMKRLMVALENPYVNLIAHPTGRVLGRRKGYDVDLSVLIERAKETGTALELNANPNRLDLAPEWVQKAQEAGVPVAINTDAHSIDMLSDMAIGVSVGRRGFLSPSSVMNTWDIEQLEAFIKKKRKRS